MKRSVLSKGVHRGLGLRLHVVEPDQEEGGRWTVDHCFSPLGMFAQMTAVSIESYDRECLYEEGVASSDGDEQISGEDETDEDEITTMAGSSTEHESDHGEQDYDRSEIPRLDEAAGALRGTGPPPVELGSGSRWLRGWSLVSFRAGVVG